MTLALSIRNVTVTYGSGAVATTPISNVSIDIPRSQVTALVGPSGSGKSTLLRVLGDLQAPTSGLVERYAELQSPVGFVFQDYRLVPFLTAAENVELSIEIHTGQPANQSQVEALLDEVGIAGKASRYPNQLSGGEQQRVAIARALAVTTDLLVADEPTGALDTVNSVLVADLFADIAARRNVAVVVATHDAVVAGRADQLIDLHNIAITQFEASHS